MKRYTVAPSTLIEVEEGYIVLHSDYAILESKFKIACAQNKALLEQRNSILARHNALVEAVAWERECRETHVACVYAGLPHLYDVHGSHYTDAVLMEFGRIRDAARAAVDALVENSGHEMRKTAQPSLTHAFLQGAKFWEFHQTSGTMWQSDQRLCAARAKEMEADGALGVDALVGEG